MLRKKSEEFRYAFPTGLEYEVKALLKKLLYCYQVSCCYVPHKPARDFQQCGILTCVDSDEPLQSAASF